MLDVGDVSAWFDALFDTQTSLKALLPGGFWHDQVPEFAAVPYGSYVVQFTGREGTSGPQILRFSLDVAAYVPKHSTGATPYNHQGIRRGINTMLGVFPSVTAVRGSAGYVLKVWPSTQKSTVEPPMRNGDDVIVTRSSWVVTVVQA